MTRSEIIEQVLIRINEMLPEGEGLSGLNLDEPTPIQDYIDKLLDESAKEVLLIAPVYLCPTKYAELTPVANPRPHIVLPDDFLKLVEVKVDSWEVPVTTFYDPTKNHALYKMNLNPYVKGGKSKPFGFIKTKITTTGTPPVSTQSKIAELFTVTISENQEKAALTYIYIAPAESCSNTLALVAAWNCAAKVLAVANRSEAKIANEHYIKELELLNV